VCGACRACSGGPVGTPARGSRACAGASLECCSVQPSRCALRSLCLNARAVHVRLAQTVSRLQAARSDPSGPCLFCEGVHAGRGCMLYSPCPQCRAGCAHSSGLHGFCNPSCWPPADRAQRPHEQSRRTAPCCVQ